MNLRKASPAEERGRLLSDVELKRMIVVISIVQQFATRRVCVVRLASFITF